MNGTPYYQPYWLNDDELEHYGVLGMKWGIRRYQNKDGTLTAAGRKRARQYEKLATNYEKKSQKLNAKSEGKSGIRAYIKQEKASDYADQAYRIREALPKDPKSYAKTPEEEARSAKIKKAAKIGAVVAAGGALTVSALLRGSPAGAVAIGGKTVDRLMRSGVLSREVGADFLAKSIKSEGTRSIDLVNWNVSGNPYYKSGPSKNQQELMTLVAQYYLEQKR